MGFFSFVSNVVSSVTSAVTSVAKSVVNTTINVVSKVASTTKKVVGEALGWMADKAEKFGRKVVEVYKAVKPYIPVIRKGLIILASVVGGGPWVKAVILGVEKALAYLQHIDNLPLVKKVKAIFDKTIEWSKNISKVLLKEHEISEVEREQADLRVAMAKGGEMANSSVKATYLIRQYIIAKSKVDLLIAKDEMESFEFYLRLRAVQKLLDLYSKQIENVKTIDDITDEQAFIINIANKLIVKDSDVNISHDEVIELDHLTEKHFNKKLLPFVFEELINSWRLELTVEEEKLNGFNKEVSRNTMLFKRLSVAEKEDILEVEERMMLTDLKIRLPRDQEELKRRQKYVRDHSTYVYAAEGLLQVLEKTEQQLIDEEKDYLIGTSSEVGQLIIQCATHNKEWEELTEEEKALITDYANIFEIDSKNRAKKIIEIQVN